MNQIESLCEKLKQEFGTSDPFELCGRMGVIVLFVKLPMHIKGFLLQHGGSPYGLH